MDLSCGGVPGTVYSAIFIQLLEWKCNICFRLPDLIIVPIYAQLATVTRQHSIAQEKTE